MPAFRGESDEVPLQLFTQAVHATASAEYEDCRNRMRIEPAGSCSPWPSTWAGPDLDRAQFARMDPMQDRLFGAAQCLRSGRHAKPVRWSMGWISRWQAKSAAHIADSTGGEAGTATGAQVFGIQHERSHSASRASSVEVLNRERSFRFSINRAQAPMA